MKRLYSQFCEYRSSNILVMIDRTHVRISLMVTYKATSIHQWLVSMWNWWWWTKYWVWSWWEKTCLCWEYIKHFCCCVVQYILCWLYSPNNPSIETDRGFCMIFSFSLYWYHAINYQSIGVVVSPRSANKIYLEQVS